MMGGESWSRVEVEATVESYFQMLGLELQGKPFNKSAHRRHLQDSLTERSEGAIERKHQNISAVLIELGFPFIDGYKPLSNYQELLRDVVEERLSAADDLVRTVEDQIAGEVPVPEVDDILSVVGAPPSPMATGGLQKFGKIG